ncbi:hypothetical protein [Actinomadura rugatobispora]|uniref:Lipoprotein n=1 Tax=Actinomadura rugatobispora TaxID=1994 RepID=A0ABW1AH83_9ACTN|nr:hypothetical protein GCM10010200_014900 [Actinomadura rugatobispora]
MVSLLGCSVLRIEQRSSQLEYGISDESGQVLGQAVQVAGPKPRKGLIAMFGGSGLGGARVVVQVEGADGGVLFYVDRQDGAPVAIVGADGVVIGRFVDDPAGAAKYLVERKPGLVHRLLDVRDRTVGEVDWEMKRRSSEEAVSVVPVGGVCTDLEGRRVAEIEVREATFKDRYTLRLEGEPAEPLRTLVLATPLALDLTRS